jgi:hypothetical protein
MRIEPLLLWSLNAVMPDGSVGIDRPDRISCSLSADAGGSGFCVPEGSVVWLGRYVVPQNNQSLAALCGQYKCTAGWRAQLLNGFASDRRFSGSLLLLNAWAKTVEASALLRPFNSSILCEECVGWTLYTPERALPAAWVGPAANALISGGAAGGVCVLPA